MICHPKKIKAFLDNESGGCYIVITKTPFQVEISHMTYENIHSEYSARIDLLLSYLTVLLVIQSDENSQRMMISSCN